MKCDDCGKYATSGRIIGGIVLCLSCLPKEKK
jgi:hypothetical protein